MRLEILGTRGEIEASAPYHSRHSGILLDGELLLDVGEAEFLKYRPRYVLITHLHPDHAFFVRDPEKAGRIDPPMYAPERYDKSNVRVSRLRGRHTLGKYDITTIPTIHSEKVISQGYRIERDGKSLFYSGDLIWIEKRHHNRLGKLDLVITEASFIRKGGMVRRNKKTGRIFGHGGLRRLVRLFKGFTDNIILVHFGSWLYKDIEEARRQIRDIAREENIRISTGYDGLEYRIE